MSTGRLQIDLDAVVANWRGLNALSNSAVETAAVVKADGYGLDAGRVATALAKAGARNFFVAAAEEGGKLRQALGPEPTISVFSGHMDGDTALIRDARLVPLLNAPEQVARHLGTLAGSDFGIQLDTGMNRLGIEPDDWAAIRLDLGSNAPTLIMSHLACADEPAHPMNAHQLANFKSMTQGSNAPRSLAATGGIILGPDYHFDLTRPGVGLYGGLPYADAKQVVRLSLPVVQTRQVEIGENVGYGNSWTASKTSQIATLSAGYADGILRHLSGKATLYHGSTPVPLVGRVSMDLLTIDISALGFVPDELDLLCAHQGVDALAETCGTIGYEILTSLGHRYQRQYFGGA